MSIITVAISGGPDSVYLLHQLLNQGEKPILMHFNHQMRGAESDADEQFVRNLAKTHQLQIEVQAKNVSEWAKTHKKSIEESGRILRYRFFEETRQKHNANAIVLGHHLNDNLETVLMNRQRGCGLRGEIGMQEWTGPLHRPLLNTTKKEILEFLEKHALSYRIDSSNTDQRFTRNRIRHKIIPALMHENPNLLETFKKERKNHLKNYERLQTQNKAWLQNHGKLESKTIRFHINAFQKLSTKQQLNILETVYTQLHDSHHLLTQKILQNSAKLIQNSHTGKWCTFGPKHILRIEYGIAHFQSKQFKDDKKTTPRIHTLHLNGDKLTQENLTLRHWKHGDRFKPLGLNGTQKLQDFFTNQKIPRIQREQISILTHGDEIVAVGSRIDERFKVSSKTKNVLTLNIPEVIGNQVGISTKIPYNPTCYVEYPHK